MATTATSPVAKSTTQDASPLTLDIIDSSADGAAIKLKGSAIDGDEIQNAVSDNKDDNLK